MVAGVAKLRDPAGTAVAVVGFGVPARLASAVSRALPPVEIAVSVALLVPPATTAGAYAAAGLLAGFVVAQTRALAQGRRPACRCFGSIGAQEIGAGSVARNIVLLALSLTVALTDSTRASDGVGGLSGLGATGWLALAVGALALLVASSWRTTLGLLRQNGRLLQRVERLEAMAGGSSTEVDVGTVLPDVSLADPRGARQSLGELLSGAPALVVFLQAGCGPCAALAPALASWATELEPAFGVRVVVGSAEDVAEVGPRVSPVRVLVDADDALAAALGVTGTPSAAVIATDRALALPMAVGATDIEALAARLGVSTPTPPTPMPSTREVLSA